MYEAVLACSAKTPFKSEISEEIPHNGTQLEYSFLASYRKKTRCILFSSNVTPCQLNGKFCW